jgi:hypothetical protein
MNFKAFLIFNVFTSLAGAAPYPATGSSALTAPEKGLYLLHKGFTVKTEGTDWVPVQPQDDSILDTVKFKGKDPAATASLSVRTDKLAKNVSLELYTKKWMRDYPNYGFEVLTTKSITLNGNPALLVDMISRSKDKQLRQVILKRDDNVAVMTCMDSREGFVKALPNCNQIMKSFSWK